MTTPILIVSHAPVKIGYDKKQCKHLKGEFLTMYKYPRIQGDNPSKMSIWTYMFNLSTSERWLLTEILNEHSYKSNTAKVIPNTEVQKNYVKHGYKKLFEDGWVTRIKRGYYMLNPVIKEVPTELMLDVVVLWNSYCHKDAAIHYAVHKHSTTFDLDTSEVISTLNRAVIKDITSSELKEILNTLRDLNWVDSNNQVTNRIPDNSYQVEGLLNECKTRGLI